MVVVQRLGGPVVVHAGLTVVGGNKPSQEVARRISYKILRTLYLEARPWQPQKLV